MLQKVSSSIFVPSGRSLISVGIAPSLLDLVGKITIAKNLHPERLGTLYIQYASVMKQIREEKDLTIQELSALCGSSSDFLQAAESLEIEHDRR